jgi:hypothetical protein
MQSLYETVALLAQGVGVGVVLSFLLERIPVFQNLSSDAKWYSTLGISVGLPVLATVALQNVPPDIWAQVEPYWQALSLGFLAWGGSQVAHKLDANK